MATSFDSIGRIAMDAAKARFGDRKDLIFAVWMSPNGDFARLTCTRPGHGLSITEEVPRYSSHQFGGHNGPSELFAAKWEEMVAKFEAPSTVAIIEKRAAPVQVPIARSAIPPFPYRDVAQAVIDLANALNAQHVAYLEKDTKGRQLASAMDANFRQNHMDGRPHRFDPLKG